MHIQKATKLHSPMFIALDSPVTIYIRGNCSCEVKIPDSETNLSVQTKGNLVIENPWPGPIFAGLPQASSPLLHIVLKFQPHTYAIKRGPIFNEGISLPARIGETHWGAEGWKSEKKMVSVWVHVRARVPDIYCGDACTAHIICTTHNSSRSLKLFYYLFYIALPRSSRIPEMK